MQQITFENWKQLDLKVGDPILIQYPNSTEIHTTVQKIASTGSHDKQPIKFSENYDGGDRCWIDFRTTYKYFKLADNSSCFALIDFFDDTNMEGYYYLPESNSILSDNVSPSKILKHSTNQNGERVWKLRKTWVTDTQIKNTLNPVQEVSAKQWMIVGSENGLQTIMTQAVFTDMETLKQEMQTILLKNPLIKLTAVELTGIQVSLDLSNPVYKWA